MKNTDRTNNGPNKSVRNWSGPEISMFEQNRNQLRTNQVDQIQFESKYWSDHLWLKSHE